MVYITENSSYAYIEYAYIESLSFLILFTYLKIMKNHNRAKICLYRGFKWMFYPREAIFPI